MESPYSAEGQNPFQTPYQAPGSKPGADQAFMPFKSLENDPVASAFKTPSTTLPTSNPFMEGGMSKAFAGRDLPANGAAPIDLVPKPQALPAAARKSQILSISDSQFKAKPEFFQTSTSSVEGYSIQSYLGLVSVEVVVPKDLLFRNPAPHGELHRLKSAEDQLQKVKETALDELSARARVLGADGIVGVTLHFSQFDAIVCLCSAVGTAVKLSD